MPKRSATLTELESKWIKRLYCGSIPCGGIVEHGIDGKTGLPALFTPCSGGEYATLAVFYTPEDREEYLKDWPCVVRA